MASLWAVGLYDFYHHIPTQVTADDEKTDAIIVLTGGQERIGEGVKLLNNKYAGKLLISGVGKWTKDEKLLANQNLSKEELSKTDFSKITFGHEAINTIGNAKETESWVRQNNIHSIRLVTANYHMPRALLEFKKRMPELKIIPNPVFPENFKRDNWREDELTRHYIIAEYTKYILAMIGK